MPVSSTPDGVLEQVCGAVIDLDLAAREGEHARGVFDAGASIISKRSPRSRAIVSHTKSRIFVPSGALALGGHSEGLTP